MRASPRWAARARRATTNIARRKAAEAGRLGPAGPSFPLAARRPDRLQLVDGPPSPYRLAHLVGLRDPDFADLPDPVGVRRKLDRAVCELRSGPARDRRLLARPMGGDRP